MKPPLFFGWSQRLGELEAQLAHEPASVAAWRWRSETRVLRFLLRRYGETEAPDDAATADVATVWVDDFRALQNALLRLPFAVADLQTRPARPTPGERAAILERIQVARDQGRALEATQTWRDQADAQIEAACNLRRLRERKNARGATGASNKRW